MVGLLLIAIGTGGIKPCVSAFGGDQFESGQVRIYIETTVYIYKSEKPAFPFPKWIDCSFISGIQFQL